MIRKPLPTDAVRRRPKSLKQPVAHPAAVTRPAPAATVTAATVPVTPATGTATPATPTSPAASTTEK